MTDHYFYTPNFDMSKFYICILKKPGYALLHLAVFITQITAEENNEKWSILGSFGFESHYVVSGVKTANESFQPNIEVTRDFLTIGLWSNLPLIDDSDNFVDEHRIYASTGFLPYKLLTINLGGTYYWFPNDGSNPNRTREFNFSAAFDNLLNPAIQFNYDFDLEQTELILAFEHEWSLEKFIRNFSLNISTAFGYLRAEDSDSNQTPGTMADGYLYIELITNVNYSINHFSNISLGPRFATNNNGESRNIGGHMTHLWWGISASLTY